MEITSYLLGKKSSGGGGGGGNNNVFVDTESDLVYDFNGGIKSYITNIDVIDTSDKTNFRGMFKYCRALKTIPLLDTSNGTSFQECFYDCELLENLPVLDLSKATNIKNAFQYCNSLSDTSLDNILQMCIGATSYQATKTLSFIGFESTKYPASKIESLPHYQDFINAGWTIGY